VLPKVVLYVKLQYASNLEGGRWGDKGEGGDKEDKGAEERRSRGDGERGRGGE
jgi:hypothetical protein